MKKYLKPEITTIVIEADATILTGSVLTTYSDNPLDEDSAFDS